MSREEIALVAHLMRRAGFGATRDELEEYAARSYESLVDDLVYPERFPEFEEDVLDRYYGESQMNALPAKWIYRMVNSHRPLEEKVALMWHHIFATGYSKGQRPQDQRPPDQDVPPHRAHGPENDPDRAVEGPGDAVMAGQQTRTTTTSPTRTTGASCWSSSRWAWGTTRRTT